MIIDVPEELYRASFSNDLTPYISEDFIKLVERKTDKVVRLVNVDEKSMGLIAGLKDGVLSAPFSAPFSGFHYTHEYLMYDVIHSFISDIKSFVVENYIQKVTITLPPYIYQTSFNAKCINAFIRNGFHSDAPDLTQWIDLNKFDGTWIKSSVGQNYRKAINNLLTFEVVYDKKSIEKVYSIIYRNRKLQGRNIYMTLDEINEVGKIFPVDFFLIKDRYGAGMGAAIFYRGQLKIAQAIFLGDDVGNRSLGIMDLLYSGIYDYYKNMDYDYLDFGLSSLNGEPNTGLIRFKETHNCCTSIRYTFSWSPNN